MVMSNNKNTVGTEKKYDALTAHKGRKYLRHYSARPRTKLTGIHYVPLPALMTRITFGKRIMTYKASQLQLRVKSLTVALSVVWM